MNDGAAGKRNKLTKVYWIAPFVGKDVRGRNIERAGKQTEFRYQRVS